MWVEAIRNTARALLRQEPQGDVRPDDGEPRKPMVAPAVMRLRHVFTACAVATVLSLSTLLDPVDQMSWVLQSNMVQKAPSGEIAFVGLDPDIALSTSAQARYNLARTLDRLRSMEPELVVLDVVLEQPSKPDADVALRDAIARYGDGIVLVNRRVDELDGGRVYKSTNSAIAADARQAPHWRYVNYLGYTWDAYRTLANEELLEPSASALLAGNIAHSHGVFKIDYRYNTYELTTARAYDILNDYAGPDLGGKKVVVGIDKGSFSNSAHIPGRYNVPASYVMILAAETLLGGVPVSIPAWAVIVTMALALSLGAFSRQAKVRAGIYAAVALASVAMIYGAAAINLRIAFGTVLCILITYAALRILWRARNRGVLFDDRTNLRTFRALERESSPHDTQTSSLIVARIHNFDDVLSALPEARHAEYIKLLSDRLRVADEDRQLYSGGNGYFAWAMPAMGRERLTDHLLGIRLLCYEPVVLGDLSIDINVTFGVDGSADNAPARKLASARNAAGQSNEADRPIVFAEHTADEEHLWHLSIQHKIDAAIESGEIYPVFQPQFSTKTGGVVGVEALVRWRDPVRGVVPTDWFIDQCEKSGRMDRLTRLMLHESMRQVGALASNGALRLSVNVSAISLQDMRLYDLVRGALADTGFDPSRLTLELTETWHIAQPEQAIAVMERIARLGVRWALDDFGAKTATYDALMTYPIDEIKIDRSLVSKVLDLRKGRRIVRSICQMGADMEIDVVAEGIESEAEFETLRDFGCPLVQGFVLSPPMLLTELTHLLSSDGTVGEHAG